MRRLMRKSLKNLLVKNLTCQHLLCWLMSLTALSLSSCSYLHIRKPIIIQGNIINNEEVSKLHKGMSSAQVAGIMGTPVLLNIFTNNRIEYVYTYEDGSHPRIEKRLTCIFVNDRLTEIRQI